MNVRLFSFFLNASSWIKILKHLALCIYASKCKKKKKKNSPFQCFHCPWCSPITKKITRAQKISQELKSNASNVMIWSALSLVVWHGSAQQIAYNPFCCHHHTSCAIMKGSMLHWCLFLARYHASQARTYRIGGGKQIKSHPEKALVDVTSLSQKKNLA